MLARNDISQTGRRYSLFQFVQIESLTSFIRFFETIARRKYSGHHMSCKQGESARVGNGSQCLCPIVPIRGSDPSENFVRGVTANGKSITPASQNPRKKRQ